MDRAQAVATGRVIQAPPDGGTALRFVWGYAAAPGEGAMRLAHARTLAFAGLVMAQLFHVFDCRSERRTICEVGWLTNRA